MAEQHEPGTASGAARIKVWDAPVRLFHWLLVALVTVSIVTGLEGANYMHWHLRSGYAILVLLLFRLAWGFAGGTYARFASFVRGPRAVLDYLRGRGTRTPGHNPLGGLSVLAMLAVLLLQTATGLFANDDIFTEGPLYKLVSKETSDFLTTVHKYNYYVICGLIALHFTAVVYYFVAKDDNLLLPMINGWKQSASVPADFRPGSVGLAAVLLAVAAVVVWFIVTR